MPPKRRATKPAAKPVDPLRAEFLSNFNQVSKANAELNDVDDNQLDEATDKAAVAQYAVVTKATEYASRQALYQPQQTTSNYDEQMVLLSLLGLTQQRSAEKDAVDTSSIQLMQLAARDYTTMITKNFGPQLTKPWAPSAKYDEDGKKRRIERPMESWDNENEPADSSFTPYVKESDDVHEYAHINDGKCHFINSETGKEVQDDQGNPLEDIQRDVVGSKAEDGVENKSEKRDKDEDSNEDEDDEDDDDGDGKNDDGENGDGQDSSQGTSHVTETANNVDLEIDMDMNTLFSGPNHDAMGVSRVEQTTLSPLDFLQTDICSTCDGIYVSTDLSTHTMDKTPFTTFIQCKDCQIEEDIRTGTKRCYVCDRRYKLELYEDSERSDTCFICCLDVESF